MLPEREEPPASVLDHFTGRDGSGKTSPGRTEQGSEGATPRRTRKAQDGKVNREYSQVIFRSFVNCLQTHTGVVSPWGGSLQSSMLIAYGM